MFFYIFMGRIQTKLFQIRVDCEYSNPTSRLSCWEEKRDSHGWVSWSWYRRQETTGWGKLKSLFGHKFTHCIE